MDLFPFLFPGKAQELATLRHIDTISEKIRERNEELEKTIATLKNEKRAFEYFKRVLMDDNRNIISKAFTRFGRFALVATEERDPVSSLFVYLEENDWDGERAPKPSCILEYYLSEEGLKICHLEYEPHNREAGELALDALAQMEQELFGEK